VRERERKRERDVSSSRCVGVWVVEKACQQLVKHVSASIHAAEPLGLALVRLYSGSIKAL
jgi:hypothetical protein